MNNKLTQPENKIRELKTIRGIEWSKGKHRRDNKLIQKIHDKLNELKL